ncbi:hypothetical protein E3E38_10580 [Thermococcus sp. 18S1]|uniref:protein kinase domain-containing protein n=1 Tax=Thermococcus sp. 18S1 TaxID=1638210 RepID=UPI001438ED06|nr:protein kinase [Thermococcus sp. 18S1]NJE31488.1 hypothetical protein [Thermococcus sp. 18S1]
MKKVVALVWIIILISFLVGIPKSVASPGTPSHKYVFPMVYLKSYWGSSAYESAVYVIAVEDTTIWIDKNFNGPDSSDLIYHLSKGDRLRIGKASGAYSSPEGVKNVDWDINPLVVYSSHPIITFASHADADYGDYEDGNLKYSAPEPGTKLLGTNVRWLYITPYSGDAKVYINGDYAGQVEFGEVLVKKFSSPQTVVVTSDNPVVAVALYLDENYRSKTYAFPLMPPMSGKFLIPDSVESYAKEKNAITVNEYYMIMDSNGDIVKKSDLPSEPKVLSLTDSAVFVFRTFYYKDPWGDDAPRYAMSAQALKPLQDSTIFGIISPKSRHLVTSELVFYADDSVKVYKDYNYDGIIDSVETLTGGKVYKFSDHEINPDSNTGIYIIGKVTGYYLLVGGWSYQIEYAYEIGATPTLKISTQISSESSQQTGSEHTIFFDDFEDYPLWSYPSSNWVLDYDGAGKEYQKIVSNPIKSGSKAFQMLSDSGCWAAVSEHKFNSNAEIIGFEADVWAESYGTKGCGEDKTSVIRLAFWNGGLDSWGRYYADLIFRHNGIAYAYSEGEEHQLTSWKPGTWYHVKVILNRKTNTYDVYIDGKLVADDILVEHSDTENINAIVLTAGHANTKVVFDNVRVFEVTSSPSSGGIDLSRGLVAYYSFDHGDARDESGNGHDGEIYGNSKCVDGVIGKAFEFDGDSYIKVPHSNNLAPPCYTVNVWFNPTETAISGESGDEIISKGYDKLYYQIQWGGGYSTDDNEVEFWLENEYDEDVYIYSNPIELNKWHMATMSYCNGVLSAYIDGNLIESKHIDIIPYNSGENLYIATGDSGYFKGLIDEVRIYNRALSEKEIRALYEQGIGGSRGTPTTPTNTQTSTPTQTQTATTTQTPTPTSTLAPIARSQIETAEDILSKIPSSIDVGDAKTMLEEARKAYLNQDYELAKKFAETAQALAVKAYYDKLRANLQVKESQGQDVGKAKDLLQQAYEAYQRKDYTKALDILSQADLVLQGVQSGETSPLKYLAILVVIGGMAVIGFTYSRRKKAEGERLKADFDASLKSGDNIVEKDPFGALEYYSRAFRIAKKLGDPNLRAKAQEKLNTVRGTVIAEINSLISRGNEALAKSDYDKALAYYRQALSLAQKLNDEEKIREAKSKMEGVNKVRKIRELLSEGDVLMEGEKYSEALDKYEEALTIAREIGDGYLIELLKGRVSRASEVVEKTNAAVSSLIGQASRDMMEEDYESAIEKLSQALVLAEKVGTVSVEDIKAKLEEAKKRKELRDKLREAKSAKDYSQALGLLGEALTLAEELGDERTVAQIRNEIEDVRKAQILETLKDGVSLILPKEIPYGRETTLSINIENRLNETIENLTVDLSELSPYFTLGEEKITFPPIRPRRKLGRDVKLKPQFKGDFDFNVRISSSLGETVKTLSVKVGDYYAPAQFTPKPLTPKAAPEELEAFYENFQYIGEGGFARVFKARRKKDGKIVAVKIPKTLDPATGKAFVREISNWLHLKHSNIVELYDVNVIPIPYLEMEYCEGSLAKLGKPMDVEQAAHIVFNIAEGLKYAHSKGIIHRDLKPSNVLLKAGIPKISDWGLSKVMSESRSSTLSSFTPYYASPEQLSPRRFGHTDARTDIWQLGVLFYELVTGKLPFEGSDLGEVTFAIINEDPVKPSKLNPEAKLVEPIIMKMLAKKKEERYQSVEELQRDLAKVLNMTYVEGLKKSRDLKRTVFYIGDLALINLKAGDLKEALKYLLELREYAGEYEKDLDWLVDQVKLAMEEGVKLGEDAVMKADVIVHQIKMGR